MTLNNLSCDGAGKNSLNVASTLIPYKNLSRNSIYLKTAYYSSSNSAKEFKIINFEFIWLFFYFFTILNELFYFVFSS